MDKKGKIVKYEQITSTLATDENVVQSKQVNGRFVTPWGGERPSLNAVFRWVFLERRERCIGKIEVQIGTDKVQRRQ